MLLPKNMPKTASIYFSVGFELILRAAAQHRMQGPIVDLTVPPMGFMSWERFRCETDCAAHPDDCIDESLYKSVADALMDGGYDAAGYDLVSIDDCWSAGRDPTTGMLRPDPDRFPSGMKALGDYLHERGLKFGLYADAGTQTCGSYEGSLGHEDVDAATFADWGVDYLKLDGCNVPSSQYEQVYTTFGAALKKAASTRKIIFSCSWPAYIGPDNETAKPFETMYTQAGCNTWRNWHDIDNTWESLRSIIRHWADYWETLKEIPLGSFNDADMLLVGDDHYGSILSLDQARLQLSFWAMIASPLFIGGDVRKIPMDYREILLNPNVIAINQDISRRQAICVKGCPGTGSHPLASSEDTQVWSKELNSGGSHAFGFFNLYDRASTNITVDYRVDDNSPRITRCVDLWGWNAEENVCPNTRSWQSNAWDIHEYASETGEVYLHITAMNVAPTSQRMLRVDCAIRSGELSDEILSS